MRRESPDNLEKVVNVRHRHAIELFNRIMDYMPREGFSLAEATDVFRPAVKLSSEVTVGTLFGKSHFDYLVKHGLLEYDEHTRKYSINLLNPHLKKALSENIEDDYSEDSDADSVQE